MLKLFIFCLLLLTTLKCFSATNTNQSNADYNSEQLELCLDEVNAQYFNEGDVIEDHSITQDDISEMYKECENNNK